MVRIVRLSDAALRDTVRGENHGCDPDGISFLHQEEKSARGGRRQIRKDKLPYSGKCFTDDEEKQFRKDQKDQKVQEENGRKIRN